MSNHIVMHSRSIVFVKVPVDDLGTNGGAGGGVGGVHVLDDLFGGANVIVDADVVELGLEEFTGGVRLAILRAIHFTHEERQTLAGQRRGGGGDGGLEEAIDVELEVGTVINGGKMVPGRGGPGRGSGGDGFGGRGTPFGDIITVRRTGADGGKGTTDIQITVPDGQGVDFTVGPGT